MATLELFSGSMFFKTARRLIPTISILFIYWQMIAHFFCQKLNFLLQMLANNIKIKVLKIPCVFS